MDFPLYACPWSVFSVDTGRHPFDTRFKRDASPNHTHTLLLSLRPLLFRHPNCRFIFNKEKHHAAFPCSFRPHDGFGLGIRPCRFHAKDCHPNVVVEYGVSSCKTVLNSDSWVAIHSMRVRTMLVTKKDDDDRQAPSTENHEE